MIYLFPSTLVADGARDWAIKHQISPIVSDKEMMTSL